MPFSLLRDQRQNPQRAANSTNSWTQRAGTEYQKEQSGLPVCVLAFAAQHANTQRLDRGRRRKLQRAIAARRVSQPGTAERVSAGTFPSAGRCRPDPVLQAPGAFRGADNSPAQLAAEGEGRRKEWQQLLLFVRKLMQSSLQSPVQCERAGEERRTVIKAAEAGRGKQQNTHKQHLNAFFCMFNSILFSKKTRFLSSLLLYLLS